MRKDNSSLMLADQTLPEPHCSILVIHRRLGKTTGFQRKIPQTVKGLRIMQMEKQLQEPGTESLKKLGTHRLTTVIIM